VTFNQFIGLITILTAVAAMVWVFVWALKRADEPRTMLVKALVSVVVLIVAGFLIDRMMRGGAGSMLSGYGVAIKVVMLGLLVGVINMFLWSGHLANAFAKPFENLFTGGSAEPDPEPFYSIARTKRKHGRSDEAIRLIEEQLESFPDDFNGLMLMAEIQALDQQNLSGASETIDRIVESQTKHPRNAATALNALADWHLQIYRDRDAALACFERIRATFPRHRVAIEAAQRIAHLPSQTLLDDKLERRVITMKERPRVVIRDRSDVIVERHEELPDEAIARLEGQLELHPLDREAREELSRLYAEHSGDLGAATEQLEFLLKQPQLDKHGKVALLHRMADLQVRFGDDLGAAEKPLKRIMSNYPRSPMAEQASRRLMMLKKEFQGKEKNRGVHLGSYEKDLGLR